MLDYGINFNVEEGKKKALKEIEEANREFQKLMKANPLKIDFNKTSFNDLLESGRKAQGIPKTLDSIGGQLTELRKMFRELRLDDNLEKDGKAIIEMFKEVKEAAGDYGVSLDQAVRKQGQLDSDSLSTKLKLLSDRWNELSLSQRKGSEGLSLINEFTKLNQEADIYAGTLARVSAAQNNLSQSKTLNQQLSDLAAQWDKLSVAQRKGEEGQAVINAFKNITNAAGVYIGSIRDVIAEEERLAYNNTLQGKLEQLEKQWNSLSIAQRKGSEGRSILDQYKGIQESAGVHLGTIKDVLNEEKRLTEEAKKRQSAIDQQTSAYKKQSDVLVQLKSYAMNFLSVYGAIRLTKNMVDITGEFEAQRISLQAILRSAEQGEAIFERIKDLAVISPYTFKDLVSYTKQLSAFSVPYNELYETTKMLADVSAGLGVDMSRIILAYGQVRSAAVLRGQELRQFTEAGIPLIDELAKKFTELNGRVVEASEVFDLIGQRKVSFEMVKDIFSEMSSEGGKFYNMQEKLAETLQGKVANLTDAFQIMLAEIGEKASPILKGSIDGIRNLMENYEKIGGVILTVASAFGTYKAAMITVATIQKVMLLEKKIEDWNNLRKTIGAAAANMKLFGKESQLAMTATWWGLALAAITAIGVGIYTAHQNATKLTRELNKVSDETKAGADLSIRGLDKLIEKIKNSERGTEAYRLAIEELNRRYGSFLPMQVTIATSFDDIKKAADGARVAILAQARALAQSKGEEEISKELTDKMSKAYEKIRKSFEKTGLPKDEVDTLVEKYIGISKEKQDEIVKDWGEFSKKILNPELIKDVGIKKLSNDVYYPIRAAMVELASANKEASAAIDDFTKKQDILYGSSSNLKKAIDEENKEYEKILNSLKNINQGRDEYNKSVEEKQKEHLGRLLNIYNDFGLGLSDEAKSVQKDLDILNGTPTAAWQKNVKSAVGENNIPLLSIQKEDVTVLDYIRRVREEYENLKKDYEDVSGLQDESGKKVAAGLKAQIDAVKAAAGKMGFRVDEKPKQSDLNKAQKDQEKIIKDYLDGIQKQVDEFGKKFNIWKIVYEKTGKKPKIEFDLDFDGEPNLEEYIKKMMQKAAKDKELNLKVDFLTADFKDIIGENTFDEQTTEKLRNFFNELRNTRLEEFNTNQKMISEYQDYADKKLEIEKKLNEDIKKLEKLRAEFGDEVVDKKINAAKDAAKKSIESVQKEILNKYGLDEFLSDGDVSDFVKKRIRAALPLFKSLSTATLSELNKISDVIDGIELPPELIEDFKEAGGDLETLSKLLDEVIKNANKAVDERKIAKIVAEINKVASSVRKLASALEQSGNKLLSSVGSFVGGLSDGMENVLSLVEKGKNATKWDIASTGISGIATIIETVNSVIEDNKKAQEEWNNAIAESVQQMRLLNIEQFAYKESSIFGMDNPLAPAIAGIKQYTQSMSKLSEITKELEEGYVQIGTKKVPKGSAYAGFVAGGAGIGGAIGSVVPVIGTVLGAVIGGLLGGLAAGISSLFGGASKTVPVLQKLKDTYDYIYDPKTFELNPLLLSDAAAGKLNEQTKKIVDNWEEIREKAKEAQEQIEDTLKNITGSIGEDLYSALIEAFDNNDLDAAMDKFRKRVNQILSEFAARTLFNSFFQDLFEEGEERMKERIKGDGDLTKDIDWLADEMEKRAPAYLKWLDVIDKELEGLGRDLDFGSGSTNLTGISKNIAQMSEDTGLVLGGTLTSMRNKMFEYYDYMMNRTQPFMAQMLLYGADIMVYLQSIDLNTRETADNTRMMVDSARETADNTKKIEVATMNTDKRLSSIIRPADDNGGGYAAKVNT